VATSCPVRSTSNAHRALQSVRNRSNALVIARKSSSVNDQLAARTGISDPVLIEESCLHAAKDALASAA
jgi:hypothetical protein